jgi:hypothetical protein
VLEGTNRGGKGPEKAHTHVVATRKRRGPMMQTIALSMLHEREQSLLAFFEPASAGWKKVEVWCELSHLTGEASFLIE